MEKNLEIYLCAVSSCKQESYRIGDDPKRWNVKQIRVFLIQLRAVTWLESDRREFIITSICLWLSCDVPAYASS